MKNLTTFSLILLIVVSASITSMAVNSTSVEFPQRGENVTWTENGSAVVDDSSDDSSAFNTAISRIGSRKVDLIFPSGTYDLISNNVTFPENITLVFLKGAILNVGSGITLTINGEVKAGISHIFSGSGTITGNMKVNYVVPQWFGVKGDGITNDSPTLQRAIDFCTTQNLPLRIPYSSDKYLIESNVNLKNNLKMSGFGESVDAIDPDCATFLLKDAGFIASTRMIITLKQLAFEGVNKTETAICGTFGGFLENILFYNLNCAVDNYSGYYSHYDNIRLRECNKGLVIGVANMCTISRLGSSICPVPIDTSASQAYSLHIRDCMINAAYKVNGEDTMFGGMVKVGAGARIENMYFESFSSQEQINSAAIEVIHSPVALHATTINNVWIDNLNQSFGSGIILDSTTGAEVNAPQLSIKNVTFRGEFTNKKIKYACSQVYPSIDLDSCGLTEDDLKNRNANDPMMNGSIIAFEPNTIVGSTETQLLWNTGPILNLCNFYFWPDPENHIGETGSAELKNLYKKGYYLCNFNFKISNSHASIDKTIRIRVYVDEVLKESFTIKINAGDTVYVPFNSILFIDRAKAVQVKALNGFDTGEVVIETGRVCITRIKQR
jgi:uncharacterized protein with GYD domain